MKRIKWFVFALAVILVPFAIALASRTSAKNHQIADLEYALENEDPDVRMAAIVELAEYGEAAVPSIRKALTDDVTTVKIAAIDALAKIGGGPSADALADVLSDPERNIRARAIIALGSTGREGLPHLLRALETEPFPRGRLFAANAIARLSMPGDAPAVMKVFERQDTATKMHLVVALVRIGDDEAYDGLKQLVRSPDPRVRYYVVNTIAEAPRKKALPVLVQGMNDESENVRMWAMFGLENLNLPESYPVVLASLEDNVWYIRKEAAYTLGNLGNPEAVPHLIPYLEDPHPLVRGDAAESLGKLGSPEIIPLLTPLLSEVHPPVQIKTAEALARLNDFSGMDRLITMLGSREAIFRLEAHAALKRISNEDFGTDQGRWKNWWEETRQTLESTPDSVDDR